MGISDSQKNAVLKDYTKPCYNDKVIFILGVQFFGFETKVCFYIFTRFFYKKLLDNFHKKY